MPGASTEPITGIAAGVPFTALPPRAPVRGRAPLLVTWHMMDAPCTDAAFAAALPMRELPAWRVHLGMPLSGARSVDGGIDEVVRRARSDTMMSYVAPIVRQAAEEFAEARGELLERLGADPGPIGVVGGSLGGAVALRVLADGDVEVAAAALVNPAVTARSVVSLLEDATGRAYAWSPEAAEAAAELDFVARADDIAARGIQPPLLVASGASDYAVLRRDAADLVNALRRRYRDPGQVRLVEIAGLAHPLAAPPGVEPSPQLPAAQAVDVAMSSWFRRHLRPGSTLPH